MGHNRNYIPLNAAKSRSGAIPNNAPLLPDQNNKYFISFKYYKENLCEISLLQKKKLKNCIDTFKRITQANIGNLKEQNIDHIRIAGTGEYKKLYNAAPFPDIEIFERQSP
ncbi:MAG: hypothetical protein HZB76_00325, partial [Chlamydiae bacterium]|nr:hypothetical protein [Chlamydiota bacterium]